MAETIRQAVQDTHIPHTGSVTGDCVTLSVGGISAKPRGRSTLLDALIRADKALYEAKRKGKNRVAVHQLEEQPG